MPAEHDEIYFRHPMQFQITLLGTGEFARNLITSDDSAYVVIDPAPYGGLYPILITALVLVRPPGGGTARLDVSVHRKMPLHWDERRSRVLWKMVASDFEDVSGEIQMLEVGPVSITDSPVDILKKHDVSVVKAILRSLVTLERPSSMFRLSERRRKREAFRIVATDIHQDLTERLSAGNGLAPYYSLSPQYEALMSDRDKEVVETEMEYESRLSVNGRVTVNVYLTRHVASKRCHLYCLLSVEGYVLGDAYDWISMPRYPVQCDQDHGSVSAEYRTTPDGPFISCELVREESRTISRHGFEYFLETLIYPDDPVSSDTYCKSVDQHLVSPDFAEEPALELAIREAICNEAADLIDDAITRYYESEYSANTEKLLPVHFAGCSDCDLDEFYKSVIAEFREELAAWLSSDA